MNYCQILATVPSSLFYYKLNKQLQIMQDKKLALNSTSIFHASTTVLFGLIYLFSYNFNDHSAMFIQINTGGYLIFDIYYMIIDSKYDLLRIMYLYHHASVYPYMLLSHTKYHWPEVLFFAELSNIPNYIVYYNLKKDFKLHGNKNYKSPQTKQLLNLQMYFYAFFRVFVLGYYGIKELTTHEEIPTSIYMTSILYIFGLIWFGAMVKQYVNNM
jgi:hypothetical protein